MGAWLAGAEAPPGREELKQVREMAPIVVVTLSPLIHSHVSILQRQGDPADGAHPQAEGDSQQGRPCGFPEPDRPTSHPRSARRIARLVDGEEGQVDGKQGGEQQEYGGVGQQEAGVRQPRPHDGQPARPADALAEAP